MAAAASAARSARNAPVPQCPPGPAPHFSKTKMCKFEILGMCAKGEECPFAHGNTELNALPDLRRTKLCKLLIRSGVCTMPDCTYAHSREELRSSSGSVFKTKPCRFFFEMGQCLLGVKCNFAHTAEELRPSPGTPELTVCPPPPSPPHTAQAQQPLPPHTPMAQLPQVQAQLQPQAQVQAQGCVLLGAEAKNKRKQKQQRKKKQHQDEHEAGPGPSMNAAQTAAYGVAVAPPPGLGVKAPGPKVGVFSQPRDAVRSGCMGSPAYVPTPILDASFFGNYQLPLPFGWAGGSGMLVDQQDGSLRITEMYSGFGAGAHGSPVTKPIRPSRTSESTLCTLSDYRA